MTLFRYGLHMGEFLEYLQMYDFYPHVKLWKMVQPMGTKLRSYLTGIGRHELPVGLYMFIFRYGLHMGEFLDFLQMYDFYPNAKLWGMVQPTLTKFRSYLTGIGRHELPVGY